MARMHSGPIPVLDYNKNWELFCNKLECALLSDGVVKYSMEELEKNNSRNLSPAELKHLEEVAGNVRIWWMELLCVVADCFEWRELINTEPFVQGDPPSNYRNSDVPFFLGSSAIVMDDEPDNFLLVMHSHAAAAFGDVKYIDAAEKFLQDSLRFLDTHRAGEKVHGVLMIGGKVSFYERGRLKFRPTAGLNKWVPVVDKEVLAHMLGLVMRAWWTMDPQSVKDTIDSISALSGPNNSQPYQLPGHADSDSGGSSKDSDDSD